jgi:hypothetical protein
MARSILARKTALAVTGRATGDWQRPAKLEDEVLMMILHAAWTL